MTVIGTYPGGNLLRLRSRDASLRDTRRVSEEICNHDHQLGAVMAFRWGSGYRDLHKTRLLGRKLTYVLIIVELIFLVISFVEIYLLSNCPSPVKQ